MWLQDMVEAERAAKSGKKGKAKKGKKGKKAKKGKDAKGKGKKKKDPTVSIAGLCALPSQLSGWYKLNTQMLRTIAWASDTAYLLLTLLQQHFCCRAASCGHAETNASPVWTSYSIVTEPSIHPATMVACISSY